MSGKRVTMGLGLLLWLFCGAVTNAETVAEPLKTAMASKTSEHIKIDGNLSEKSWEKALPVTGFHQIEPYEGQLASESTLVKVLYDNEAVYVGWWCYDREPDRIVRQLTRRDRITSSDEVHVRIDSHHDHQTAYYFAVNAAGVIRDALIYNNLYDDDSWDAVWEASSQIHDWGWTAEYKIPYSALKFAADNEYTWGFDLSRRIARKQEYSRWQFVPSTEATGVHRYGHLTGIKGIEPAGRIEILPYSVSYAETEPKRPGNADGRKYRYNFGTDIKYTLSSTFTLDATVNPDFGQVEADQDMVNLNTYEIFYNEKRPFFLEGFEIFRTTFFNQFYSRRIGRPPMRGISEASYYIDYPNNTTILEAFKLTGKNRKGTSIGLLNATTQEEKAAYKIDGDMTTYEGVVEPLANYSVARLKQDIKSNSYIGAMVTSVNQKDTPDAYTVSTDWNIFLFKNMYIFEGQAINTYNGPGTSGYAFATAFNKNTGKNFRGNVYFEYYDKKVNWNRLGYLERNNLYGGSTWWQLRSNKVFAFFRHMQINLNAWTNRNFDGYRLSTGGNLNGTIIFTNNWATWTGFARGRSRYDDLETRGNGLWLRETGDDFWIGFNTNDARKIYLESEFSVGGIRSGDYYRYLFYVNFRPVTNFEFSLGPNYNVNRNQYFWVGTGVDDLPVFAQLDNDEVNINFRGIYTFQKNLTLQWFTQFYISAGDFGNYYKLEDEAEFSSVDTAVYAVDINPSRKDFNYKSLNLNLILRWEYRPGSTLYAVWTNSRSGRDAYGDFQFHRDFDKIFKTPQYNTFLIKFNYWWNI